MKVEELPSGSYRVRKQVDGKKIAIIFDHKPSNAEVIEALAKHARQIPTAGSFLSCANSYIDSKSNVTSPSTIRGYKAILKGLPDSFVCLELSKITQIDIQKMINDYSVEHKPKTVRNAHGFISAVLKQYMPDMLLTTTLPQKIENRGYIPNEEDIKKILDESIGSKYHIPIQLGIMSLRRSEICALELSDIKGNTLSITKALVQDENDKWVVKQTKTAAGTRELYIPDNLVEEIRQNGTIYDGYPNSLNRQLHKYQDKLGIPRFRFHDLRHFFATYAHSQGISDADIMATGGWKSDYTMKSVYRHEMKQKEAQQKIFTSIIG